MSFGLTQIGATLPASTFAVVARRVDAKTAVDAVDRMGADAIRAVQPSVRVVDTPVQIRAQVMADRGVDSLTLLRLSPQARIEAEVSINAEAAQRARQAQIRSKGNFLDLRV